MRFEKSSRYQMSSLSETKVFYVSVLSLTVVSNDATVTCKIIYTDFSLLTVKNVKFYRMMLILEDIQLFKSVEFYNGIYMIINLIYVFLILHFLRKIHVRKCIF